MIAAMWMIFSKAGQPGWAAIVPIYNFIVLLKVAKKPLWWIVLIFFVPVANIIFLIMTYHGVSVSFGKGAGFTVGIIFLPFIFLPILAFGSAEYITEEAAPQAEAPPAPAAPVAEAPAEEKPAE